MLAVRKLKEGVGNIEVVDIKKPILRDTDVMMKVWAAGVCGSDLNVEDDTHFYRAPVTLGHEYSGIVTEIGKDVTRNIKVGDKIVADIEARDGWIGSQTDGAFAAYMRVPEYLVHVCPSDMSLDAACLTEPVVATLHCLQERNNINADDFVVVIGPGPMGILSVQFAKLRGARKVILVGLASDTNRLEIGKKCGADETLVYEENAYEKIMEMTNGEGADFVSDCAGTQSGTQLAIDICKISHEGPGGNGRIALVAMWGKPITLNLDRCSMGQLNLCGGWSWNGPETWDRAIRLLYSGKIDYKTMVNARYNLQEWDVAFRNLRAHKDVKAFIHPNGTDWAE